MTKLASGTNTGSPSLSGIHPMRITERAVYRGPHLFSVCPMIRIQIDLGELENWPTNRLPGFAERLPALLPGLHEHGCSYGRPGGFVRRMQDGTWLGHVIEHVALELQTMAGSRTTRGKTRSVKGVPGVYDVLYAWHDETAGIAAGAYAARLVVALLPPELQRVEGLDKLPAPAVTDPLDVSQILASLREMLRVGSLGPTTRSLVEEARRRGIPVLRLNEQSLVQLGHGSRQRRLRASITGQTSQIAVDLAGNKRMTKQLLAEAGLPVPVGVVVRTEGEALKEAVRLGWPLVTKPLDGNHGRGVTTNILSTDQVPDAFAAAAKHGRYVIVERQFPGKDYRILVVNGKVVAVAERIPAHVVGDGLHSISELIAITNADPRRGEGHEKALTRIRIDDHLLDQLGRQGKSLDSMASPGEMIVLRGNANLSTGGIAVDRTDEIHPENIAIAEQAAITLGLDVAGIDFLAEDIGRPASETGGGIVEVNAAPGFRMHLEPSEGTPRDVAKPVIDMLYPHGSRSRIPIFAITGTNGKSTTARMVAHILRADGRNVGLTTTSGVYCNEHLLRKADASGPRSARMLLRNPKVDVAVLETARGGILREGLGFDRCAIGAVLNVAADHLGLKGIDTLEDLARVKSVVVESVSRRGYSILNADDPSTVRMARHAGGRLVWFSMNGTVPLIRAHIENGGMAVVHEAGSIVLYRHGERTALMAVADIPATVDGMAAFNVQNALAAVAMCAAHGVSLETIRMALSRFECSFRQSPGRLNIYEGHPFRVIVDYAHNPASLAALGDFVRQLRRPGGRIIGMVSIPGDRRDQDILEMGRLAGGIFDEIICRETPDGRGRPPGQVNSLLSEGALRAGIRPEHVHRILDEEAAANACLRLALPGDLVVLLPTSVEKVWNMVQSFRYQPPMPPPPSPLATGYADV